MGRRFRAGALSLLLLASPAPALQVSLVAATALAPTEASAQGRSSGGYSRSRSASSRTPSFGGGGGYSSRTPSTSGGYSRRSASPSSYDQGSSYGGFGWGSQSSGDQSFSRQRSGEGLSDMRAQNDALRRQQEQAADPYAGSQGSGGGIFGGGYGGGYGDGYGGGYSRRTGDYVNRSGWLGGRGWSAPGYAYGRRSFGIWDGLFLWFMLDNLSRPGYGDFFHNHQDDPGYQQWRAEAERQAADNAELRQKLDALDRQLAEQQGAAARPELPAARRAAPRSRSAHGRRRPHPDHCIRQTAASSLVAVLFARRRRCSWSGFGAARRRRRARPAEGAERWARSDCRQHAPPQALGRDLHARRCSASA